MVIKEKVLMAKKHNGKGKVFGSKNHNNNERKRF